jgi:type VI secretion system protein ImpJ
MYHLPLNWSEGMFLRPHHFQSADRHWNELFGLHQIIDQPYGYGVFDVKISEESLANGVVELGSLKARFRDGSILWLDSQQPSIPMKSRLEKGFSSSNAVTLLLAVPQRTDGRPNTADLQGNPLTRFVGIRREVDDETSGGNRREVELKRMRHSYLLSNEDTSGYDFLPIARLTREATGDHRIRVDKEFFPPSLTVQSWDGLSTLLKDLRQFLNNRLDFFGGLVRDTGASLSTQVQGDLEKMLLLHAMNEAFAELSSLAFSMVHPLVAYHALCRIVGRCSIFGPEKVVQPPPVYNHDDLHRIFRWADVEIRRLINSIREDEYVQRYFTGAGKGMRVTLDPEWFSPEWEWYFGAFPVGVSAEQGLKLLGGVNMVLGAADRVENYLVRRQPGLKLSIARQLPRAIANRANWLFFQIRLEGEAWDAVRLEQTLAMRVQMEQITNLESLESSKRLRLNVAGEACAFEFAIFAVKKRI